jgi:hypothetical protein
MDASQAFCERLGFAVASDWRGYRPSGVRVRIGRALGG